VFNVADGRLIGEWMAHDPAFRGGVHLAAANIVSPGGVPNVITGAGRGAARQGVQLTTGATVSSFMAYDANFRGGVTVAGSDAILGILPAPDSPGIVITGVGPGGGPHVKVFNGVTGAQSGPGFMAYDPGFRGGVTVAWNGLIVTAPGAGGGPVVRTFDFTYLMRSQFLAYDANFRGGVRVADVPTLGPPFDTAIVTGPHPGSGPHVKVWQFPGPRPVREFLASDPAFTGGVFVG
jgi:hypothetical protein